MVKEAAAGLAPGHMSIHFGLHLLKARTHFALVLRKLLAEVFEFCLGVCDKAAVAEILNHEASDAERRDQCRPCNEH